MNVLDLIFPKKCLECGRSAKYLCSLCLKNVPPSGWTNRETYSCFKYEGVIRKAIIALKYKFATDLVDELAGACVKRLDAAHFSLPATLVPVPLHWYRQNFRGFNQSAEIGKRIAAGLNWQFIPDLLIRQRPTTPQVQLKGSARRQNLRGAFFLDPNYNLFTIPYPLVLFDDVVTTGSTLKEVFRTLKNGGAGRVFCLTVAN